MAVNVDKIEALEILKETYDNAERISNEIGDKISLILEGSHKTYKYIFSHFLKCESVVHT